MYAILDFPAEPAVRLEFRAPRSVLAARSAADVRDALLRVEAAAHEGAWAVGFVAYEAAPAFDAALVTREPDPTVPLLCFGIYDAPAALATPRSAAAPRLDWRPDTERDRYDAAIHRIRALIAAGDVYQVNHTLRFHAPCSLEPAALYDALVAPGHGAYCALIDCGDWAVISASPELFFELHAGDVRRITTRPMKGTVRRGRWLDEDRAAAARLAASTKDRAENLMIVDLLRNDLGRVARFGSVRVPRIYDIETYPTVHQMTSTITAELRDGVTLCDVFAATFPCGSVTGAPKVTAMRSIAQLEDSPRGPYCGAIGVVRPDGSATFNVAIRTVLLDRVHRRATFGAGGGITWDSRAADEYDEVVAKAALLDTTTMQLQLLETMRCDYGAVARLELHMQRLAASAAYWSFSDQTAARARDALAATAASLPRGSWRLRLTASPDGVVHITHAPLHESERALSAAAGEPATVRLARSAVSRLDPLLFHKTTARAVYDARRADHRDAFDVLLFNREGLVTEFTSGNLVAEIDGRLLTPPRGCGLLGGTLRRELLDAGIIHEAPITLHDVRSASRLWHTNSVRGCTPVALR
jgi:para-aminobenzoate synthetase / 4-amino-4-deoxychorismate lyase